MASAVVTRRETGRLIGWIIDSVFAFVASALVNFAFIVGVFAFSVGRARSVHIPSYLDIVVDERGGFDAGTHDGVAYSILALAVVSLFVARLIRHARGQQNTLRT